MTALTQIFSVVLRLSVQMLPVLAVVLAARALLLRQGSRRLTFVLWAVMGFRLLCPVSLPSPLSLFNLRSAQTVQSTARAVVPQLEAAPAAQTIPPALPAPGAVAGSAGVQAGQAAGAAQAAVPALTLLEVLAVIWAAGMALLLVYSLISYLRLRRSVAQAVRLEDNVYECDAVTSPFVLGFFRPRVYIPFRLSAWEKSCILLHEQTHIRRRDYLTKPLAFLILTAYWFHPGVWLSWLLLCRDMEMSCDEAVLRTLGSEVKADYSRSLLRFAAARSFPAPSPLAFGEHDASARIKHVLQWKKAAPAVTFLAVSLCVLAAAVCGTDAWQGSNTLRSRAGERVFAYDLYTWSYTLPEDAGDAALWTEVWLDGERVYREAVSEAAFQEGGESLALKGQFRLGGRLSLAGEPQWALVTMTAGTDLGAMLDYPCGLPEGLSLDAGTWTAAESGPIQNGGALLTLETRTQDGQQAVVRLTVSYDALSGKAMTLRRTGPKPYGGNTLSNLSYRFTGDVADAVLYQEVYLRGELVSQEQVLPETLRINSEFAQSGSFQLGSGFYEGRPYWLWKKGRQMEALPVDLGAETVNSASVGVAGADGGDVKLEDRSVLAFMLIDTLESHSGLPGFSPRWDEGRIQRALAGCDAAVLLRLRLYPKAGTARYQGEEPSGGEVLSVYRSQGSGTLDFYTEVYDHGRLYSREKITEGQPMDGAFAWGTQMEEDWRSMVLLGGILDEQGRLSGYSVIPVKIPDRTYGSQGFYPPGDSKSVALAQGRETILGAAVLSSYENGRLSPVSTAELQSDLKGTLERFEEGRVNDVLVLIKAVPAADSGAEASGGPGILAAETPNPGAPYPASFGALNQYGYTLPGGTQSVTLYEELYEHGELIRAGWRIHAEVGREAGQLPRTGSLYLSGYQKVTQRGCEGNAWYLTPTSEENTWQNEIENHFSTPGLASPVFAFRMGELSLTADTACLMAVGVFPDSGDSVDYEALLTRGEDSVFYDLPLDGRAFAAACAQDRVSLLYLIPSTGPEPVRPVSAYAQSLYQNRTAYLGDAPAVGRLLEAMGIGEELGSYTMEMTTSERPYVLQLNFREEPPDGGLALDRGMSGYGALLLALVENLEEVRWTWPEEGGGVLHTSYYDKGLLTTMLSGEARFTDGSRGNEYDSIKDFSASSGGVQNLLDWLSIDS